MISVNLTNDVLSLSHLIAQVETAQAGAIATFSGNVRSLDHGKMVSALSYEIHPSTETVLNEVVRKVAAGHSVIGVAVAHRYGEIPIGESAFLVAVSAPHRSEAFAACMDLVDEVKAQIPIWKHQVFTDGTDEWVNCA